MGEEEVQENTERMDGLGDEIGRLADPSLEFLRDMPMYSPPSAFTGWWADLGLSPSQDFFAVQCEWASFDPMYRPQRSPSGWCADQEQPPQLAIDLLCPSPPKTLLLMAIHLLRSVVVISSPYKKFARGAEKRSKRKHRTKHSITLDDLRQCFGLKREEAAQNLGVSIPTFKRCCRQNGITRWNGDECSLVDPKLLNNAVHHNSPGSKPPEVEGEKETSALLIAKQDMVTIKAKYGERTLKFRLTLESGVAELNEAVAKRVELELGSFIVEYEDEDQEWVWIACDEDLQECVKFSSSLGNQVIRLSVTDRVFNSEKSRESCEGLKRKRS